MRWFVVLALITAAPGVVCAVRAPRLDPRFRFLVRDSARIFSGEVLKVEHLNLDARGLPAVTRITFKVERAIRGVRHGQVVQVNEWQGLWNAGERYQAGEHVLLFLYPPSKLGLTSPVGGAAGRFRMDDAGRVILSEESGPHTKAVPVRTFLGAIRGAVKD